jgi:hypothetical protein
MAFCSMPSLAIAQESILNIVQQREQAASERNPPARRNTTTKVEDITTKPENMPKDFGSKPSTRPQYVKGLQSPKPRANTTVPPKKILPANGLNQAKAPKQSSDPNKIIPSPGLPSPPIATRKKTVEADPYAPDGIKMGSINVLPYVGAAGGYNTNPAGATKPKGSSLYQLEGGLSANSDWSTHAFNADLRGIYTDYTGVKGANQPEASARIGGRIDVTRDTKIDIETRARLASESVSDIDLPTGVTQRPKNYTYGASLGGSQRFGNTVLSVKGSADRTTYDSATAASKTIDQSDRDQNIYALRLRAGYEISPGITPFVDVTADTRQFDKTLDRNGFQRQSNGLAGRVGTSFELTRTLTGEVAVGYGAREFRDKRLKSLNGLVSEANLVWSISPLTAVRLKASSDLQDTTGVGATGVQANKIGVDVEHALLRNLSLGASADYERDTTQGAYQLQNTFNFGLRADYKLTKEVVFRTGYTFQKVTASYSGGNYSSNQILFGLRLQR